MSKRDSGLELRARQMNYVLMHLHLGGHYFPMGRAQLYYRLGNHSLPSNIGTTDDQARAFSDYFGAMRMMVGVLWEKRTEALVALPVQSSFEEEAVDLGNGEDVAM